MKKFWKSEMATNVVASSNHCIFIVDRVPCPSAGGPSEKASGRLGTYDESESLHIYSGSVLSKKTRADSLHRHGVP